MNDPSPFTLLAFMLVAAKRRGVDWNTITGTSNQSDYLSHFVANHMFFRLALPGARRILIDHIAWCRQHVPRWNPLSVVGQHMQQAGATPAEAMAFTLSSAVQYADDCIARGMDPDEFLPRFTFFFDISLIVLRGDRQVPRRPPHLGAPRARAPRRQGPALVALQVPRPDLGRRPDAPAAAQQHRARHRAGDGRHLRRPAVAAHRRLRRGAIATPSEVGARIAVATQNILREEAHLTDVIDPLGGSFYVESLTDQMEAKIVAIMNDGRRRRRHVQGGRVGPRAAA